jgi:P27 family predicted phage terminase small subunit
MAGRRPKPTQLKRLQGNPGKRPLNKHEPQPPGDRFNCPSWLSAEAKGEWRRIVPQLRALGLATRIDHAALEAYCEQYARWREATLLLREVGLSYETSTGFLRERPEVGVADKALKNMRMLLTEFGMTPASRSRISVAPPPAPDPFEEFLRSPEVATTLEDDE